MSYAANITKSIFGRQLGLRQMSSGQIGSTHPHDLLVGAEGVQQNVTTAESTAVVFRPFGVSVITTESSGVHTMAPPIPGVEKTIYSSGGATGYVKTKNSETLESSRGSTFTTMKFNGAGIARLVGLTTARWLLTGMGGDSGDSANAPAIALSTST